MSSDSSSFDDDFDDEFDDNDVPAEPEAPAFDRAGGPGAGGVDGAEDEPELEFESVYEFVDQHLSVLYARQLSRKSDVRWCPRYWAHPEAMSRLEALWRTYEHLRLDPATGMSVWWRDHVDHHMPKLLDPDGAFAGCSVDEGHKPTAEQLPIESMDDAVVREIMSANYWKEA